MFGSERTALVVVRGDTRLASSVVDFETAPAYVGLGTGPDNKRSICHSVYRTEPAVFQSTPISLPQQLSQHCPPRASESWKDQPQRNTAVSANTVAHQ